MSVLRLPLLVDRRHKVGELVLCIISCPSIIILENACFKSVCRKSVVMVTLTTGMISFLFTYMHFCVWEIFRKTSGPRVR
jgi:hypothetical protein